MNEPLNPYRSSSSSLPASMFDDMSGRDGVPGEPEIVPASRGLRLVNLLIDSLALLAILFGLGVAILVLGGEEAISYVDRVPSSLVGFLISLLYYVPLEATTSRTLGKLITGTMVVNRLGQRPTLNQICGRTCARMIPLEAFTFLKLPCRGWHDAFSNTYVIKSR